MGGEAIWDNTTPMQLYICADMEGATGIVHRDDILDEGGEFYKTGCRLLTGDVNAAIEGAVAAGVSEVVISEGHSHMRNILLEKLHPAARLIRGPASWENKPLCQLQGLHEGFELAFFIGFHTRAGTPKGLLAHTWAGSIVHEITLQGKPAGETMINAVLCGSYGIPVGLVSGGDDVCREALADLGEVELAETKKVLGWNLAECWGPTATHQRIFQAAQRAVQERHRFRPVSVGSPVVAELETHRREMADRMSLVPGLERIGPRRLRCSAADPRSALSALWHGITEAFKEPADWLK
jgi:D-amino peptidase